MKEKKYTNLTHILVLAWFSMLITILHIFFGLINMLILAFMVLSAFLGVAMYFGIKDGSER